MPSATPDHHSEHAQDDNRIEGKPRNKTVSPRRRYWIYAPGKRADRWDTLHAAGLAAIGWDELRDLRAYTDKAAVETALRQDAPDASSKASAARACWEFAHVMRPGDVVFAKRGMDAVIGYGLVDGAYDYDASRDFFRHVRPVRWLAKGDWPISGNRLPRKTLTDITRNPDLIEQLSTLVGFDAGRAAISSSGDDTKRAGEPTMPYTKQMAMDGLFLTEAQFDDALDALRTKKNVILQGPPGVGKTFVARRLARALIESTDPERLEMIQFHQSYSYEDFIEGFRPTSRGAFELRHGIFHRFCLRARREDTSGAAYVFIIDEINRGNLSKIFGELMMLIEPDKRGSAFGIPLTYEPTSAEPFYLPENLYLIGTMNTADRSLAMVDYALRRRFRFLTLRPAFDTGVFGQWLTQRGASQPLVARIVDRMRSLNESIAADTKNLGPGYEIGHSFFCPRNGETLDDTWYQKIVEHEIVPLIQEYWFDDDGKVEEARQMLLL